ncbi:MAG: NAD-dependent epimerase/dehydratase family protein [bacterium]
MEKIIVTGGAGFIGSHIVDTLLNLGYEVHVVDNLYSGKKDNLNTKAIFHNVDIREKEKLNLIFKGAKYVFHEAALPQVQYSIENPIETHDINVTGLLNVLEASKLNNVKRLIFASSSAVYGDQKTLPLVETMEARPLSPYGAHKYIGEVYCCLWSKIFNLETVCLRYFNVYGKRQSSTGAYASVVAKFIDLKKKNQPMTIVGDGNQTRSFVNVKDVVDANIKAMEAKDLGKGEVVNIGTNDMYSVNQIANLIGGDVVYIEPRIEPKATLADVNKAKLCLDWIPNIKLEDGLIELKKYYNI